VGFASGDVASVGVASVGVASVGVASVGVGSAGFASAGFASAGFAVGCASAGGTGAGTALRAARAIPLTDSAWPCTSAARLWRNSRSLARKALTAARSWSVVTAVAVPPAALAARSFASATIRAASSRARWMISSACRETSSRSGVPTTGPAEACARSRSFSARVACNDDVSSSRNSSTSRIR
jgi:hypothetical protein